jgi:hypothetical protein
VSGNKVYLGKDPFVPGRRIEVDPNGLVHDDDCQICRAVRLAQKGVLPAEDLPPEFSKQAVMEAVHADHSAAKRDDPDETIPPSEETAFVVVD